MRAIETWQIKRIWAVSKAIGMTRDEVHLMADAESLKEISFIQANDVLRRLDALQGLRNPAPDERHKPTYKGVSAERQRKVWALMYELEKYDTEPSPRSIGERLCRIIRKELQIDCTPKKPFIWLTQADANKLIEVIKGYVATELRKKANIGGGYTNFLIKNLHLEFSKTAYTKAFVK